MVPGNSIAGGRWNRGRRGNNIIEFSLMVPWYIFLFVGAYDFGFYSYSLIATQTAAQVAGTYCSTDGTKATDATNACTGYVIPQLKYLPNIGAAVTTCAASPLTVTATLLNSGTTPASPDGQPATLVSVAYVTPQLIPIPGLLPGQITITKTVTMRLRSP